MRAMVLAAGLGTRLRPLTNDRPKALVEIAGRTLLEMTLARLHVFGVHDVIVNVHHFAGSVEEYLLAHDNFGMHIEISYEAELLDTGGGIKKAAWFFTEGAHGDEPFLVHNVDVVSEIDLARMMRCHVESNALATLAMQKRDTSRPLLFDEHGVLCGRRKGTNGADEIARPANSMELLAFAGIHVISPCIFTKMREDETFPIIAEYLRLAAQGEKIVAFRADEYAWRDVGKPESIRAAEQEILGAHSESQWK